MFSCSFFKLDFSIPSPVWGSKNTHTSSLLFCVPSSILIRWQAPACAAAVVIHIRISSFLPYEKQSTTYEYQSGRKRKDRYVLMLVPQISLYCRIPTAAIRKRKANPGWISYSYLRMGALCTNFSTTTPKFLISLKICVFLIPR